ncbi:DUF6270 domain-containing protein [Bacillus massiliglaciei]|uniref:DUF6270 domain-containing protein n=1 Tax=Bacillus massiliglaciei TaxID=1816693 RepID=UPI000DA6240E|nr:DUF6270 domain-containing protein [Bacillus massiliglaciei]
MKELNILGSCVSRDIFRLLDTDYKVNYYHARSSILSLMSAPYPLEEQDVQLKSRFKQRTVLTDMNKTFFQQLEEKKNDLLMIDFIDERFALYQIGFSYVTRSSYFVEAGLKEKLGGREVRKADTIKEWETAVFVNIILSQSDHFKSEPLSVC